jgi:cob(I)alamin adenosyltransferase
MAGTSDIGLVHIYTGTGKGKTTAAFGLALRAAGAGISVSIHQFIKGMPYSENASFRKLKNITLTQCGRGCFLKGRPGPKDIACARKGLEKARNDILSGRYGMVILDEANIALKLGLIKTRDVVEIIKQKPGHVELVLTGRHCPRSLYEHADFVTEMRKVKHPFDRGVQARKGIEY